MSRMYGSGNVEGEEAAYDTDRIFAPRWKKKPWHSLALQSITLFLVIISLALLGALEHKQDGVLQTIKKDLNSFSSESAVGQSRIMASVDSVHELITSSLLPEKHSSPHITPVKSQGHRGTCWIFATVGVLEQSYRKQGVESGFLNESVYVEMNEQAYGVEIIRFAKQHPQYFPDTPQPKGDTNDGYTFWLFYFREFLKSKILPSSTCPYITVSGNDTVCDGIDKALDQNPLRIKSIKLRNYYDLVDIKRALLDGNPMTFEVELTEGAHYVPCTGSLSSSEECQTCSTRCPEDSVASLHSSCCQIHRVRRNPDGTFYSHHDDVAIGGHAMLLVGYNDNFNDPIGISGLRIPGGFIIKNSWGTSTSHSIAYYMQQISREDEDTLCPNTANPRNWVWCKPRGLDMEKGKQRTVLQCKSPQYCGTNHNFCVLNITASVDDTVSVALQQWEIGNDDVENETLILPSLPLAVIQTIFEPVESQRKENSVDACGFNFYAYDAFLQSSLSYGWFWSEYFDIEWEDSSYSANEAAYSAYNYTLLHLSENSQRLYSFVTPLPWLN